MFTDCTMSVSTEPFYDCTNDILTIYWPTDELYTAIALDPLKCYVIRSVKS